MYLGAFSLSLTVKDINISKEFYERIGFVIFGGDIDQNWLIMSNGETKIGLFQGMFEDDLLTFNPGWNSNAEELENFKDIRQLQKIFENKNIKTSKKIETTAGPANFIITDPDGHVLLFDQHR